MKKLTGISIAFGLVGSAAVVGAVLLARQPETTSAMRGRQLASDLGCFGCHGPEGTGGVADPTAPGGRVPDWRYVTAKMFIQSEQDIRDWIVHGESRSEVRRRALDDRESIAPMPAYGKHLTPQQVDDLVAYFLAVSGWHDAIPDEVFEGRNTAIRLGCFGCHGPSGMGGVANPGSFKGHIPSWTGQEFTELVRDEQELRQWILCGTIERLERNPVGRFFLRRQKTPMPAYEESLSDNQLDKLVAYIQWLRSPASRPGGGARPAPAIDPGETAIDAGETTVDPDEIEEPVYYSPAHICLSPDGRRAYVANQTANTISVLDVAARKVIDEIPVGRRPTHVAISPDGRTLFVTCLYAYTVDIVDVDQRQVVRSLRTGFEPMGLALSADGRRLSVANAVANTVSIFDLDAGARQYELPVGRFPRYLAETADGRRLIVGNAQSRDVSIIDPNSGRVIETRSLGRSTQMRHVVCTHDGRWAILTTLVGHDEMITMQMERGWINSNGLTVIDLQETGRYVTVLLDRLLSGATNPWALALAADDQRLYVSLAGMHQVAIVDLPALLKLVGQTTPNQVQRLSQDVEILERLGIARRVDAGGLGPRGLALCERTGELLVANYFSDTVSVLDAETGAVKSVIQLGPEQEMTAWRRGQMLFNDGRICYQNWYSCASCHQEDATVDALSWDLINDGTGNPKNVKSMHDGIVTPPAMWSGIRPTQNVGVMAGQRFLGFLPDDEVQAALMQYIGRPRRAPNPYRRVAPEASARGKRIFYRARCDSCHIPPLFTDQKKHDIGLTGYTSEVDFRSRFDTPSLLECYRTSPYLHDGRAATLQAIFADHNPGNAHGRTAGLSVTELDDLAAYLRSL